MQSNALIQQSEIAGEETPRSVLGAREYPRTFKYESVINQVRHLEKIYASLSATPTIEFLESGEWHADDLPQGAHAWAAFPRADKICGQYMVAATAVSRRIAYERPTADHMIRIPEPIRRISRTMSALKELEKQQPFDIQVVAVQMGGAHRAGYCIDETKDMHWLHEIPMGLFEGLNILMVNRGRLESPQDIGVMFGGDRFGPDFAPAATIENRVLKLSSVPVDTADPTLSEASWFLMK